MEIRADAEAGAPRTRRVKTAPISMPNAQRKQRLEMASGVRFIHHRVFPAPNPESNPPSEGLTFRHRLGHQRIQWTMLRGVKTTAISEVMRNKKQRPEVVRAKMIGIIVLVLSAVW